MLACHLTTAPRLCLSTSCRSAPDENANDRLGPTTYTAVLTGPSPDTPTATHSFTVTPGANSLAPLADGDYTLTITTSNGYGAGETYTHSGTITGEWCGGGACAALCHCAAPLCWLRLAQLVQAGGWLAGAAAASLPSCLLVCLPG